MTTSWSEVARRAAVSGNAAGLASMAVLLWRGRADNAGAVAPLNAPSHVLWGDAALRRNEPSLRYPGCTTAVAAVVDLVLVPKRLTPGFERRLSGPSLVLVYAAFGLGLFAADRWLARRSGRQAAAQRQPEHR